MNDMSKIGDTFPIKMKKQYVRNSLQRGLVVKIKIVEQDYEKYFVFMGYDYETNEACGFFINTPKKYPALSRRNLLILDFQVAILQEAHSFLKYNSTINCYSYEGIDFTEMVNSLIESPGKICGVLNSNSLEAVEEAVESNPVLSSYEKNVLTGPLLIPMF